MHTPRLNATYRQAITTVSHALMIPLAILLVMFATGLLIVRSRGEQLLSVQTGSMVPTLRPGDAVIVRPSVARNLHLGDIISYQSPRDSSLVITHRLTRIDKRTGWLTTTGDALHDPDPTFPPRLVVGRVTAVAPKLGLLLNTLRHPVGLAVIIYLPAITLIVTELRRIASQYSYQQYTLFSHRQ